MEEDRVARYVRDKKPHPLCDACLALATGLSLEDARRVLAALEGGAEFQLKPGTCAFCGQAKVVIRAA